MSDLTRKVMLRLTEDEYQKLSEAATTTGQSMNNYVRTRWLGGKSAPSTPTPNHYQTLASRVEELETRQTVFEAEVAVALKKGQDALGGKE